MSENLEQQKQRLLKAVSRSREADLFDGSTGFISLRIFGSHIIFTTLNYPNLGLKPNDLRELNLDETSQKTCEPENPSLLDFIGSAFQLRPEINAIGHFHPPAVTAFTELDRDLPIPSTAGSGITSGEVLRVACKTCTSRFAGLCQCFESRSAPPAGANILLIKSQGIVILHRNLKGVVDLAIEIENIAKSLMTS